ncbi:hypothetical protein [Caulobacter sp. DWR2-3-1b2]|uniref:hypothetical protein n=1 Tax=Caulobacter sp. DWR2-3-1b2 TaxID=2804642 RepID=UPI003CE809CB
MSATRARLLAAASRPTTVTQVALDHGFWELGRFAGAYRGMFGEAPSEAPSETPRRAGGGLILQVPAARAGDQPAQSGLVIGHYLHPDAPVLSVLEHFPT